jgi:DNA-binding ferritin-like protein (Dps family)
MALSIEQQAQIELQNGIQARQNKLEAIRMAKDVLIENARSKPVESREVTAADITAFADALVASINA